MKENSDFVKINSISDVHKLLGLPKPLHPLISLIDTTKFSVDLNKFPKSHVLNFYKISYKTKLSGKLKYGQGYYDFNEGGLLFAAPKQIIGSHEEVMDQEGFALLIHPDFLLGDPLAKKIKQYGFFSYSANEALYLSDQEKDTIFAVFKGIELELQSRIDDFSQGVILAQIALLLTYIDRFYKRQFITRKVINSNLLERLEDLLDDHFNNEKPLSDGIPSVLDLANQLAVSPSYLSDMLRSVTGQNAQQLIHHKIVEKAKEILSTSELSIAQVAYQLGFEYPQSFSRLFKAKTNLSPHEFRNSFN